jgi:hypothetical protein
MGFARLSWTCPALALSASLAILKRPHYNRRDSKPPVGAKFMSDHIAEASYYRMTGIVYWENAKILEAAFRSRGDKMEGSRMAVPFYFLISHAIELLLKCARLKRGTTPEELKKVDLRHNLKSLLSDIEAKGVPIKHETRQIIHLMSEQHKLHKLRYDVFFENSGPVYVPKPEDLYGVLDEVLMAGRISTHGV